MFASSWPLQFCAVLLRGPGTLHRLAALGHPAWLDVSISKAWKVNRTLGTASFCFLTLGDACFYFLLYFAFCSLTNFWRFVSEKIAGRREPLCDGREEGTGWVPTGSCDEASSPWYWRHFHWEPLALRRRLLSTTPAKPAHPHSTLLLQLFCPPAVPSDSLWLPLNR